jgi:hypothetical protein
MRFRVKAAYPVEAANAAARKTGFAVRRQTLERRKPETAYFIADAVKVYG